MNKKEFIKRFIEIHDSAHDKYLRKEITYEERNRLVADEVDALMAEADATNHRFCISWEHDALDEMERIYG